MAERDTTTIEWTATRLPDGTVLPGYTFNPWTGCTKVSPACANCYAEGQSKRNAAVFGQWGPSAPRKRTSAANWRKPQRWDRQAGGSGIRRKVFCASMADLFEDRPELDAWREDLWQLIRKTPNLDWLLLTKRPDVMAAWAEEHGWPDNAWAGTTVEDQRRADERIPHLLRVPARVRFLSMEPLLEAVDLGWGGLPRYRSRASGLLYVKRDASGWPDAEDRCGIDWVIVGGESGPGARPMHPEWARSLRDQCQSAAFFFKQWGAWAPDAIQGAPNTWMRADGTRGDTLMDAAHDSAVAMSRVGKKAAGRLLDGREWNEVPHG